MLDIKTIPDDRLKQDLDDSYKDIMDCTTALKVGVTQYSGGSIEERLNKNKHFVKVITAEIKRRKMFHGKSIHSDPCLGERNLEADN